MSMSAPSPLPPPLHRGEGPFPADVLVEIKANPGNNQCCDCGSFDTEWASVSFGVLICLRCSGFHRSLGVNVSFVRSISLDSWTPKQVYAMRLGSNFQMQEFFRRQRISNTDIRVRYQSKAAAVYRVTLAEAVEKGWQGDWQQRPHPQQQQQGPQRLRRERQKTASLASPPRRSMVGASNGSAIAGKGERDAGEEAASLYEVRVEGSESIGVSIQKHARTGRARVYRVATSGPAHRAGVQAGDELVGLDGRVLDDYDDIMALLPNVARPFRLVFRRLGASAHRPSSVHAEEQNEAPPPGHVRHASSDFAPHPSHTKGDQGKGGGPLPLPRRRRASSASALRPAHAHGGRGHSRPAESIEGASTPADGLRRSNGGEGSSSSSSSSSSGEEEEGADPDRFKSNDGLSGAGGGVSMPKASWGTQGSSSVSPERRRDRASVTTESGGEDEKADTPGGAEAEDPSTAPPLASAPPPPPPAPSPPLEQLERMRVGEEGEVAVGEEAPKEEASSTLPTKETGAAQAAVGTDAEGKEHPPPLPPVAARDRGDDPGVPKPQPLLGKGSRVYVRPDAGGGRWRSALVIRFHKTRSPVNGQHLLKVQYRNGTVEEYVDPDDVALTRPEVVASSSSSPGRPARKTSFESHPPPVRRDMHQELSRKYSAMEHPSSPHYPPGADAPWPASGPPQSMSASSSSSSSSPPPGAMAPQPAREYEVVFGEGPMGFTLSKAEGGRAVVTKVAPAGQAVLGGVRLGDAVVSLDHQGFTLYDQIMARLPHLPRPLVVGFRKKMEGLGSSAGQRVSAASSSSSSSSSAAGGGGKAFAGGFGKSLHVLQRAHSTGVGGGGGVVGGSLAAGNSPFPGAPVGGGSGLTTKVALQEKPGRNEFDTWFHGNPLGMRLEEMALTSAEGGLKYVSQVLQVTSGGAAEAQGVLDGCVVVGINGERALGHAHTVATLKHGKRPVAVRFRLPS